MSTRQKAHSVARRVLGRVCVFPRARVRHLKLDPEQHETFCLDRDELEPLLKSLQRFAEGQLESVFVDREAPMIAPARIHRRIPRSRPIFRPHIFPHFALSVSVLGSISPTAACMNATTPPEFPTRCRPE